MYGYHDDGNVTSLYMRQSITIKIVVITLNEFDYSAMAVGKSIWYEILGVPFFDVQTGKLKKTKTINHTLFVGGSCKK